ncbi:MAG: hypothetical protein FVQ85_09480 [Planctomycetes bacterium]|nr:hypothetical protein [Planctomycetota bacterium]
MQAQIKSFIVIILIGFVSVGFARGAAKPPGKDSAIKLDQATVPSFPYASQITDNDVPVRSGPGTNYYICGKLKKSDKAKVVGSQFSWSRIVPPPGSFSWISMRYVSIDPDNPTTGIVTSDGIRVYAGSDYKEPIHSETLQLKLNRGDEVKFIGKQKGDYYKITPPAGAYLWVSTKYIKPLAVPVKKTTPTVIAPPTVDKKTVTKTITKPDPNTITKTVPKTITKIDTKLLIPAKITGESENLKAYYTLEKLIRAERAKPANQQNYTNIKNALTVITGNKDAGKAARYSKYALRQLKGFELALVISKEVQLQNEELQKTQKGIDQAHTTRAAQIKALALGRFAVIGKFETSSIFSSESGKRYRIVDNKKKTVCYASPTGAIAKRDLSKLAGSKVGLIGKIVASPQTSGALVRFTEIVELN